MLRRELLKSLAGLVGLAVLPLAALVPKYQTGGIVKGKAPLIGEGECCNYLVQAAEAERLANWAALRDVIVTTEMRGGELRVVDVRGVT